MTDADHALIRAAREIIAARGEEGRHHIGAALRTRSGSVFAAVHLETYVGRAAVCAEAIALGMAAAAGDAEVEAIVAVDRRGQVVTPCGICREMLSDYAPEARVIVPDDPEPVAISLSELLPYKYERKGRS